MPTAAERNALYFLAAVALVGGGARAVGSARFIRSVGANERLVAPDTGRYAARALTAQIAAVDSARAERQNRPVRVATARGSRPARKRLDSSSGGREPTIPERIVPPRPSLSVDVNRATLAELERLPRVGPALARRIIAWREQHGPFRSTEDLRHVRGIGPATAALLAPVVTF
jgi:competence ComEA-like helix-hairpin-helix protein